MSTATPAISRAAVEDLASLHGEPDWLRTRRREPGKRLNGCPCRARTDEEWRRTDIRGLDLSVFEPFEEAASERLTPTRSRIPAGCSGSAGRSRGAWSWTRRWPAGRALPAPFQAAREYPDLVRDRLFTEVRPDRDRLTALHAALFTGGTFLYVPEGVVIEQPLVSQFFSPPAAAARAAPHADRGRPRQPVQLPGRVHRRDLERGRRIPQRLGGDLRRPGQPTSATSRSSAGAATPGSSPTSGRGSRRTRRLRLFNVTPGRTLCQEPGRGPPGRPGLRAPS